MQMKDFRRTSIIIMLAFILMGITAGTVIYTKYPETAAGISGFIKTSDKRTLAMVFKEAFRSTFLMLILLMFSGFSAVSQPLELGSLIYRGIILGISFSYTYVTYAFKGIFICVLMILPHALATSVILVLAVRESMRMSNAAAVMLFKDNPDIPERPDTRLYLLKFMVLVILLLISSAIDCIITYLLTGMLIIR